MGKPSFSHKVVGASSRRNSAVIVKHQCFVRNDIVYRERLKKSIPPFSVIGKEGFYVLIKYCKKCLNFKVYLKKTAFFG